jgi:tRNA nucleotidyltransferase (CCA-adding enzyme)
MAHPSPNYIAQISIKISEFVKGYEYYTHEQADFDALASLLGAHLVDERAIPVLPRRMNRNVHAFVTLYGVELPFVDPRDLPGESVESVTLVDTQSMVSIKGMDRKTQVRVIDHHPPREGLPPAWQVTTEDTGATATLFVETLQARDSLLSPIEATLLLLGIYEDTGSLTYTRTTPRDLSAAAYLLEHGASLQIAAEFLNHPLSLQQQALYDRLRASTQGLSVNGHSVLLACGDSQEMDEELSTVAHKMRDLLDPDALILLVKTHGGVR